jgi:hypothetical protein
VGRLDYQLGLGLSLSEEKSDGHRAGQGEFTANP